jgi:RNA polymerase sigma-70 factor (ECF subfamily)
MKGCLMKHGTQNTPTDNQVMQQVRDGDVDKLGLLFEKHNKKLFNYFLRLTSNRNLSEDLVQEVFIRIMRYRTTYKGEAKFAVWMYKIAHNIYVDYFRKYGKEEQLNEEIYKPKSKYPIPEDKLEKKEEFNLLRSALNKLSVRKREILILSRFHGLKYAEIAQLLGCRTGTIKVHVHRAIKDLGKIYTELSGGKAS